MSEGGVRRSFQTPRSLLIAGGVMLIVLLLVGLLLLQLGASDTTGAGSDAKVIVAVLALAGVGTGQVVAFPRVARVGSV